MLTESEIPYIAGLPKYLPNTTNEMPQLSRSSETVESDQRNTSYQDSFDESQIPLPFNCDFCDKSFSVMAAFKNHLTKHFRKREEDNKPIGKESFTNAVIQIWTFYDPIPHPATPSPLSHLTWRKSRRNKISLHHKCNYIFIKFEKTWYLSVTDVINSFV